MSEDRELKAMGDVLNALHGLELDERKRVMQWVAQKLALDAAPPAIRFQTSQQSGAPADMSNYSTDTIANIIGVNSGRDLIMAAAAYLHFSQGRPTFTRQELANQMRSAPSHFRSSYINNLSSYLTGLTRSDRLRLLANDTYALSNRERQNLEQQLAAAL